MKFRKAFTLVELLIVIAVIAILAALLFPAFALVRGKARQLACSSNFKQQTTAIFMYVQDYDERMPLSYYGSNTELSPPDQVWGGQPIQPYLKNTRVYACPADPANEDKRKTVEVPYPATPAQILFNLGFKNNFGINYQYLCPVVEDESGHSVGVPTHLTDINYPATTLLAVDSIWDLDNNGNPYGGGSFAVDPPCRFYSNGEDSFPKQGMYKNFLWWGGWNPDQPNSALRYGYAWPWHGNLATVAFCDGHAKPLTMDALAAGCDVKPGSSGTITDADAYLWDLR